MTSYADRLRDQSRLDRLRPVDADEPGSGLGSGPVPLMTLRPLAPPADDSRPCWTARLDGQNRLCIGKAVEALGWAAGTELIGTVDRSGLVPAVVLTAAPVTVPTELPTGVDSGLRVRLAPAHTGVLDLASSGQALIVAEPAHSRVCVYGLASVVPLLTAELAPAPPAPTPAQEVSPAPPARRTDVRRPFQAAS